MTFSFAHVVAGGEGGGGGGGSNCVASTCTTAKCVDKPLTNLSIRDGNAVLSDIECCWMYLACACL